MQNKLVSVSSMEEIYAKNKIETKKKMKSMQRNMGSKSLLDGVGAKCSQIGSDEMKLKANDGGLKEDNRR